MLSAEAIADAALEVAHRRGLSGVTIRGVARAAGTSPMAIYTYFTKKEELLNSMAERLMTRLFASTAAASWPLALESACRRAWTLLREHREWVPLLTRVVAPASCLPAYQRLLALMCDEESDPAEAMHALSSVFAFTLGIVLLEATMTRPSGVVVPAEQLRLVHELFQRTGAADAHHAAAARAFATWSFEDVFESGLRALVSSVETGVRCRRRA